MFAPCVFRERIVDCCVAFPLDSLSQEFDQLFRNVWRFVTFYHPSMPSSD
jgi:hypothetical protein